MANLTRIQNNQIYDSTIQAQQKIATGSITGNLIATNVTLNSNVTILGNLTVSNSYSQLNSINTYINDPIVVFNNGFTGSIAGYDIGILINRNLENLPGYGAVNTAWVWSESDAAFLALATTETGTSVSSMNNSGYANVHIGNLTAVSGAINNNLTAGSLTNTPISGSTGSFTYLTATTGLSTANAVISGGYISSLSNIIVTTANVGTLNTSTGNIINLTVTGTLTAADVTISGMVGNANVAMYEYVQASTTNATFYPTFFDKTSGNAAAYVNSSLTYNPSTTTLSSTNLSGTSGTFTTAQATNFSTGNARITGGDVNGLTTLGATTATATNLSSGNAVISGGSLNDTSIGATTASTGRFTSVYTTDLSTGNALITGGDVNGLTTLQATTAQATNLSSGNVRITGGSLNDTPIGATTASTGRFTDLFATNLSTGNALITGGDVNGLTTLGATTAYATNLSTGNAVITNGIVTNFSTANALITGGNVNNLTTVGATTAVFTNISSGNITGTFTGTVNAVSTQANVAYFVSAHEATNNSTYYPIFGNVSGANTAAFTNTALSYNPGTDTLSLITLSASSASITDVGITTLVATNFSTGNARITDAGITTLVATNFSTANARVTGGYADNYPIGANVAAPGTFTKVIVNDSTNATGVDTGAFQVTNGGASVMLDLWVGGNIYVGNLISQNTTTLTTTAPLVYLNAEGNPTYDYEIGIYSNFVGGSLNNYQHTGFIRSHTDNEWYLFSNLGEPSGGTVDTTNVNIIYDTLHLGTLHASNTTAATSQSTGALIVGGGAGFGGTIYAAGFNSSSGNITTLYSENFSSGNVNITGGTISGVSIPSISDLTITNFQSGNAVITGGYVQGLANVRATEGYFTNFSTGNAVIIDAGITTLYATNFSTGNARITDAGVTTLVATNLSSGNAVVTGGYAQGLANVRATEGQFTNFSTGNARITGGDVTGLTTLQATNFSTGNALITGGDVNGLTTLGATTAQATNLSTGNALITGGTGSFTTLYATNFSTGNAVISGGYVEGMANVRATEGYFTNLSTGNLYGISDLAVTNFSATTAVATNFSSGNAVISGGSLNNTPIGATTASTGRFTTVTTTGVITSAGNLVANSGAASTTTTTGALVVKGGAGVSGDVNIGGQVAITKAGDANDGAGQLYLNGATSNRIDWAATGTGAPAFSTRSAGTKLVLYPSLTGSTTDYAMGVDAATMWSSVPESGDSFNFKWYGATTEVASLSGAGILKVSGNIVAASTTDSTSSTTGALVVAGGVGVSANVYIGGSTYVNKSQLTGRDFIAQGVNDSTLLWARPKTAYDQVVIGGNAFSTPMIEGAKLVVNSTDSILIPVGDNSQRPGVGSATAGMLRYSTTSGSIEYYNGAAWQSTSSTITIITEEQFIGDGSETVYTLSKAATTASCIVSINGVIQIGGAGYAYTVSSTTLTFTEAPSSTDIIDVRILTTTSTVRGIASDNGYMTIQSDNDHVTISTGVASAVIVRGWIPNGAEVNSTANVTATGATTVDSFSAATYSSAEYIVTATSSTGLRAITKLLVAADGTSGAYVSVINTIDSTGGTGAPGVYSVTNTSGTVNLVFTPTSGTYTMRVKPTYQAA